MAELDLGPAVLARVRAAADMLEVVGEHVHLRRRGRRYEGLCPFHEEKTPSFSIDPEKGLYYCFGCNKGGDIIGSARPADLKWGWYDQILFLYPCGTPQIPAIPCSPVRIFTTSRTS